MAKTMRKKHLKNQNLAEKRATARWNRFSQDTPPLVNSSVLYVLLCQILYIGGTYVLISKLGI